MKSDIKDDTPQKLAKDGASPLLDVRQLSLSFGSKTVVNAISFSLNRGEKLALVGESGSGKTVTALSLLRLLPNSKTQGQAYFHGRASSCDLLALSEAEMRGVRGRDIAMIFQEPMTALNPLLTIGAQIAEVLVLKRSLTRQQAEQAAITLLSDTGIPEPARRAGAYPHQLSGGQRQRAVIAMALACEPQLLLADEPTTALDVSLRGQILDLLSNLQQRTGMAVLLITHDLNLVKRFADRVAVMENGLIVEQGRVAEVFARPQHPYTQKLLDSRPVRNVVEAPEVAVANITTPSNEPANLPPLAIAAQQLRVAYPTALKGWRGWFQKSEFVALSNAAFNLAPATTLGVIGESGSGKSTLAQAVLGLYPFQGDMHVLGQMWDKNPLRNSRSNKAIRRQIQVVFQDPFSSLSPRLTVGEIVAEGLQVHADICLPEAHQALVLQTLEEVGLSAKQFPGLLQRYPHEFSGGQRQRIAIARALILNPKILVLDEPTSALDVTIQKQVLQLLQRLQKEKGLSYLLITHDVEVVRAMAHQVIVIKNGTILESGSVNQVLNHPQNPYTQALVAAATA